MRHSALSARTSRDRVDVGLGVTIFMQDSVFQVSSMEERLHCLPKKGRSGLALARLDVARFQADVHQRLALLFLHHPQRALEHGHQLKRGFIPDRE